MIEQANMPGEYGRASCGTPDRRTIIAGAGGGAGPGGRGRGLCRAARAQGGLCHCRAGPLCRADHVEIRRMRTVAAGRVGRGTPEKLVPSARNYGVPESHRLFYADFDRIRDNPMSTSSM